MTALIGTPSAPASVSSTTDDLGLHVTWVKGSTVPLRRFLVTATYSGLDKGGISFPPAAVAESPIPTPSGQISQDERTITLQEKSVPITMQFSFSAATREAPLPAPDGRSVSVTVRECTDRGCGPGKGTAVARAGGPGAQLEAALDRQFVQQQMLDLPLGVFSMRTGLKARPNRTYGLLLSWGTWRRWRDLSELRLRLRDRAGLLATLRVGLHSGRLVLSAPGGHARQGRIARRGALRAGRADAGGARRAHRPRRPAQPARRPASAAEGRPRAARSAHRRRGRRRQPDRPDAGPAVGGLVRREALTSQASIWAPTRARSSTRARAPVCTSSTTATRPSSWTVTTKEWRVWVTPATLCARAHRSLTRAPRRGCAAAG